MKINPKNWILKNSNMTVAEKITVTILTATIVALITTSLTHLDQLATFFANHPLSSF